MKQNDNRKTDVVFRSGFATMVAMVSLAIVACTVLFFTQTIVRERRTDATNFRHFQAESLAQDMMNITAARKQDMALTVSKRYLDGIVGLEFKSQFQEGEEGPGITVTVSNMAETNADEKLSDNRKISFTRRNIHAKRNETKK